MEPETFKVVHCDCSACTEGKGNGKAQDAWSEVRTPWAVFCWYCEGGSLVYMTNHEYSRQLSAPGGVWICPGCGTDNCYWSDVNHQEYLDLLEDEEYRGQEKES